MLNTLTAWMRRIMRKADMPPAVTSPPSVASPTAVEQVPAAEGWQPGQLIAGQYRVIRLLGEGGMGRVWLVHHLGWGRDLAVKEPHPEVLTDRTARRAFSTEAENWVRLPLHPNIVTAYYVRELEGVLRIFAEFVDGEGLDVLLGRGPLPPDRALEIALQCCDGLGHAQAAGLIHRDVKPNNVLLSRQGAAKLVDFGLAKAVGLHEEPVRPEYTFGAPAAPFTARGGTRMYMSPEQRRREQDGKAHIGPASDIWSFGVMFYEMLTGARPDRGELARQFVLAREQTIPEELYAIILRCLEKQPAQRWASFEVLGDRLRLVYQQLIGDVCPLPRAEGIAPRADDLNNRALSLLDLGKPKEAARCWREALGRDPYHLHSVYNQAVFSWRSGTISDEEVVQRLSALCDAGTPTDWRSHYFLGLLQIERGERPAALAALRQAERLAPAEPLVQAALVIAGQTDCAWGQIRWSHEDHTAAVTAVALSADGHWALSAGEDRTLRVRQCVQGGEARVWTAHRYGIMAAALSSDGQRILSAGVDNALRLWETATGNCLGNFSGGTRGLTCASLAATGRWAITGARDGSVHVWDGDTGTALHCLARQHGGVNGVGISADGQWAISGGDDQLVHLWKALAGRRWAVGKGHDGPVAAVTISADGQWAISGSWDKTVRVWKVSSGRCVRLLRGHHGPVTAVALSADGRRAVSGSDDRTVRVWDTLTGRCLRTFRGHALGVTCVAISADGRGILSGGEDHRVCDWQAPCPRENFSLNYALGEIRPVEELGAMQREYRRSMARATDCLSRREYVTAHELLLQLRELPDFARTPELLHLWADLSQHARPRDIQALYPREHFTGHRGSITALALSRDATLLLSGSLDGALCLWEVTSGERRCVCADGTRGITSVYLSRQGQWGLSGHADGTLLRWDFASGVGERCFPDDTHNLSAFSISANERALLFPAAANTLELWDFPPTQARLQLTGHLHNITATAMTRDGRRAITGDAAGAIRHWDLRSGQCVHRLAWGHGGISAVAVSGDSRSLYAADASHVITCWDLTTDARRVVLQGHRAKITGLAISPDNGWVLSGSLDETARVWNVHTGECRYLLDDLHVPVTAVAWSPDGRWIFLGGSDATLRCWEVDRVLEACPAAPWDAGAASYLDEFLYIHGEQWLEEDLPELMRALGAAGYGWLDPAGVIQRLVATQERTPRP